MLRTSTEKGKSDVSDQSLIREVFPRHTAKKVSWLCSVPLATASHWVKVKLSSYRNREVFLLLLEEFDRETERRAEIRQRLCIRAGLNDVEITPKASIASAAADLAGAAADRVEAAIEWIETD